MIVVRVELHSAITGKATELARMLICNEGGSRTKGDYSVEVLRGRSKKDLDKRIAQRGGRVLGHARLALHVWHLVAKALRETGYGESVGSGVLRRGGLRSHSGAEDKIRSAPLPSDNSNATED